MISTLSKKHYFDTVFDSQKVFRLILEAMANPARIASIKKYADKFLTAYDCHSVFLTVAMTLLDNEISFNACENHSLTDEIASLTLAKKEKIEEADFIFIYYSDVKKIENVIESVKCGTLADPHKSATVIIKNFGEPDCRLAFSGPGIDGDVKIETSQIVKNTLALRDAQNYEYPQGIDLIFISDEGELFAIPRLVKMEVV